MSVTGKVFPGDIKLAQGHLERALELDPTLRQRLLPQRAPPSRPSSPMALDAATEEAIIERAIRNVRRSAARQSTSRGNTMRSSANRPNMDSLFQRDGDSRDRGPDFAQSWESRFARSQPPRKVRKAHAFDTAEPDRDEALKHLDRIRNHVSARAGSAEYDSKYVADCMMALVKALNLDDEGTEKDAEDDHPDEIPDASSHGGPVRVDRRAAKDGVGETPARPVAELSGKRDPDHRKDFNDIKQGGADDAALFDPQALFQRGI
jgi:hypothetical protein